MVPDLWGVSDMIMPWPEDVEIIRLAHKADRCTVLGPGCRAVLWVQGCPFRCPGCIAPQAQPFCGGQTVSVTEMADHLVALEDIQGLTLSGGEPMCQAPALSHLIDRVRAKRDMSVLCYTGYEFAWLMSRGTESQRQLLYRLDLLIDGEYIAERHTDLQWRGSDNQRLHVLSPRHADLMADGAERGIRVEFSLGADGSIYWMGIPPAGFSEELSDLLRVRGIVLEEE